MTNRFLSGATCLLLAPVAALAGCTSAAPPAGQRQAPAQPRVAVYRCDEGRELRIENLGGMVRVLAPADTAGKPEADSPALPEPAEPEPVELAAAPPGQQSRYGADGYALVLEGREALWMKAGKAPLTCLR